MTKTQAMDHWNRLAHGKEGWATYLESRGEHSSVARCNAKLYYRTAESLRLEIETGKPHCTVCLGPHPNHECPRRNRR